MTDRPVWRLDSPDPVRLSQVSDAVDAILSASGLSERARFAARLVTEELVLNAFEHGAASEVTLQLLGDNRLAFEDDGRPFDPSAAAPESVRPGERGRGLSLVQNFAKSLEHSRAAGRNRTVVLLPDE